MSSSIRSIIVIAFWLGAASLALANELPAKHHGIWEFAGLSKSCSKNDWGKRDSLMKLSAKQAEFWESRCRIVGLNKQGGKTDDEFVVDQVCGGEGEEWIAQEVWQFAEIGGETVAIFANITGKRVSMYRKCGSK